MINRQLDVLNMSLLEILEFIQENIPSTMHESFHRKAENNAGSKHRIDAWCKVRFLYKWHSHIHFCLQSGGLPWGLDSHAEMIGYLLQAEILSSVCKFLFRGGPSLLKTAILWMGCLW